MTSANVVQYSVKDKSGKQVYNHYQHCYCRTKWHKLLDFTPAKDYTIMAYGEDEEEEYWENEPVRLDLFIEKLLAGGSDFTPWEMNVKPLTPQQNKV